MFAKTQNVTHFSEHSEIEATTPRSSCCVLFQLSVRHIIDRLQQLVNETSLSSDGEHIVAEWCLKQRHHVLVWRWQSFLPFLHSWPCTQSHLHGDRKCRHPWQLVRHFCLRLLYQDRWQGIVGFYKLYQLRICVLNLWYPQHTHTHTHTHTRLITPPKIVLIQSFRYQYSVRVWQDWSWTLKTIYSYIISFCWIWVNWKEKKTFRRLGFRQTCSGYRSQEQGCWTLANARLSVLWPLMVLAICTFQSPLP